jgi:hypothetical protein
MEEVPLLVLDADESAESRAGVRGVAEAGLHGALAVLLGYRAEGGVAVTVGLEALAAEVGVGRVPVGVVGEVEGVEAEGQRLLLVDGEVLLNGGVEVGLAGSADDVAVVLRGEGARRGRGEDERAVRVLDVEPQLAVGAGLGEAAAGLEVGTGGDVEELRTAARADAGDVAAGGDGERRTGLELVGLGELPAAEGLIQGAVGAVEGDGVDRVEDEDLLDVVVGGAAVALGVVGVGDEGLLVGVAVGGVGQRVGDAGAEAVLEAAVCVHLQALVEGAVPLCDVVDGSVALVGTESVGGDTGVGGEGAGLELVDVGRVLLVQGPAADVGYIRDDAEGQLALD